MPRDYSLEVLKMAGAASAVVQCTVYVFDSSSNFHGLRGATWRNALAGLDRGGRPIGADYHLLLLLSRKDAIGPGSAQSVQLHRFVLLASWQVVMILIVGKVFRAFASILEV